MRRRRGIRRAGGQAGRRADGRRRPRTVWDGLEADEQGGRKERTQRTRRRKKERPLGPPIGVRGGWGPPGVVVRGAGARRDGLKGEVGPPGRGGRTGLGQKRYPYVVQRVAPSHDAKATCHKEPTQH